jgi:hypothetical protein
MARYGIKSKLNPTEALEAAVAFFGPDGIGLTIQDQDENCATFIGSGGYVSVFTCEPEDDSSAGSELELETREWDYDVKRFMASLN